MMIFLSQTIASYLATTQIQDKAKPIPGLPKQARYDFQAEITGIGQQLFRFSAPYSSSSSLPSRGVTTATETATLYAGAKIAPNVEIYANPEVAWGTAAGGGQGLGGYLDGDYLGQNSFSGDPYLARLFTRIRIPMKQGKDQPVGKEDVGRAPNFIEGPIPQHRLVVTAGRLAASDIFDFNSYANNPRTQFIDNAFVNGLAYDFPQDPRGYGYGAAISLVNPAYAIRFGTFAVPVQPAGERLAYNFGNDHSEQLELQISPQLLKGSKPPSIVRLLLFRTVANMGSYADALASGMAGTVPSLNSIRSSGSIRTGAEVNFEQGIADGGNTGVFARLGFADAGIETDAYAEADQAASVGFQLSGAHWKRKDDLVGLATAISGIGSTHQAYLGNGGSGFNLGDGKLSYGPESVTEAYYMFQYSKTTQLSLDLQALANPGYNRDRGPAGALTVRVRLLF